MRLRDYIEQSFSNLWKKKLRTSLTTCGVVIGIGALVSMMSFGEGVQKNVTDTFRELELFNYVGVFPDAESAPGESPEENQPDEREVAQRRILNDEFLEEVMKMEGVEAAFPELRFPAQIKFKDKDEFGLIQVLPAQVRQFGLVKLRAGDFYTSDEENSLIISDSMLRRMDVKEPETAIGEEIELHTLTVDSALFNPASLASVLQGEKLPFAQESYTFTIVGVAERTGFGGPMPIRSDVMIPPGAAENMKKLLLTSLWDFFESSEQNEGYSAVGLRLSAPRYIEPVKAKMEEWGFKTFALVDQLTEIKRAFLFMDMFLFAVGMIGIVVATLGIINTMVMSILERYKEIGIMKAIGASDGDVKKIFFFECEVIGFLGGVFGLALGWSVSMIINQIANSILAGQGAPFTDYFSFPWWLCLGAIAFSMLVSLAAGIYPAIRAARVDPVVALRHD
ncbi:MAG: ABC transporter permease [Phycisphaerales bacterium]|nr:MAG: ABC transporter permease [Phycisphaerales bacterium]